MSKELDLLIADVRRGNAEKLDDVCVILYPNVKQVLYNLGVYDSSCFDDYVQEVIMSLVNTITSSDDSITNDLIECVVNTVMNKQDVCRKRQEDFINRINAYANEIDYATRIKQQHLDDIRELHTLLEGVLDILPGLERKIISDSFGLEDGHVKSQIEIACETNLTLDQIEELQFLAMNILRSPEVLISLQEYY